MSIFFRKIFNRNSALCNLNNYVGNRITAAPNCNSTFCNLNDKAEVLEGMSSLLCFYLGRYRKKDFWMKGSLPVYNYQGMIKDEKEASVILAQLGS